MDELIRHGLKALAGSLTDGELTPANTTVRCSGDGHGHVQVAPIPAVLLVPCLFALLANLGIPALPMLMPQWLVYGNGTAAATPSTPLVDRMCASTYLEAWNALSACTSLLAALALLLLVPSRSCCSSGSIDPSHAPLSTSLCIDSPFFTSQALLPLTRWLWWARACLSRSWKRQASSPILQRSKRKISLCPRSRMRSSNRPSSSRVQRQVKPQDW